MFMAGSMIANRRRHLSGGDPGDDPSVDLGHGLDPDGRLERGHHESLFDILVLEVGAGERGQLQVQVVGLNPWRRARWIDRLVGQIAERQKSRLDRRVVAGDPVCQGRKVGLQRRLDDAVLLVGVADEKVDDPCHVRGEFGPGGPACRVDAASSDGGVEQLGADAFMDVAVEVNGYGGEGPQSPAVR